MSRKLLGLWKSWGYLSMGWIGYESSRYDKTIKGYFKSISIGVYKATICWIVPPLGVIMIWNESKNLDFSSTLDY